jgi:hypothetical protein
MRTIAGVCRLRSVTGCTGWRRAVRMTPRWRPGIPGVSAARCRPDAGMAASSRTVDRVTVRPRAVSREDALTYGSAGTRLRRGPAPADSAGPAAGDWLSGRAPRSHRGGHWFDPSIAHRCKARSETPLTALILLGGWELSPYWEESGRSCSPARVAGPRAHRPRPARPAAQDRGDVHRDADRDHGGPEPV